MNDLDNETETPRPMNGWEAAVKIVGDILVTIVFLAGMGLIYLLGK
jgi:hypothetical protein